MGSDGRRVYRAAHGELGEQLVLAVQCRIGEVNHVRQHISHPVLGNTKPLREAVPHSLPEPGTKRRALGSTFNEYHTNSWTNCSAVVQCMDETKHTKALLG